MKKTCALFAAFALALAACAPAPETALPAAAEETMHMAETEEAMHMEDGSMATEAALRMAETEEAMHMEAASLATEEAMHMAETETALTEAMMYGGAFVKEEVSVTGSYTFDPATGKLAFSEDFGVVTGPDLFVILSGASDLTVDYQAFSNMVTNSPQLSLGKLAKTTGAQTYTVPADADLSQFKTVVIWCESFSVAFAAAPLAAEG